MRNAQLALDDNLGQSQRRDQSQIGWGQQPTLLECGLSAREIFTRTPDIQAWLNGLRG